MWSELRSRRRRQAVAASLIASIAMVTASRADAQAANSGWQFEITPYGWLAAVSGSVGDDNLPSPGLGIEQTWSDIFANLEFALMGSFEVRKGRWGIMGDGVDFRVRGGGTLVGTHGFTSLNAEGALAQKLYSAAAVFRVREGTAPVDVMGGARYAMIGWDIDIELSRPPVSTSEQALADTRKWVDPYVGARIQQPISKRWSLIGYGDVGGLGVGSKLSMQGRAAARFAFTRIFSGSLGYRVVSQDYDKDGFRFDMVNAGPILGVSFRW